MSDSVDIAVIGSGASGLAAAITAARAGARVLLLDERPAPGGTGGFSGLTTLCGLYDDAGNFLNDGFAREFAGALSSAAPLKMGKVWVLPYRPEKFCALAAELIAATPNLEVRWNTSLSELNGVMNGKDFQWPQDGRASLSPARRAEIQDDASMPENASPRRAEDSDALPVVGGRIITINSRPVGAVVDCSGFAVVARALNLPCLETDATTQAPAVVFALHNVTRDLSSLAAVAQVLLPLARAGLPPVSLQPNLEPNSVTVKLAGRPEQAGSVIEFLRHNVEGFEECVTPVTEFTLAHRAGRMIPGHYTLTGDDVLAARKFPDAVARCAWPIEQWNTDGVVRCRYLPPGACYEIPARALRSAAVANLFMAGKTLSADADAIASARVMGCGLATGAAAGQLAVASLESARTR